MTNLRASQNNEEPWAGATETVKLGSSLYEMARLTARETGLPYDILLDSVGKDRQMTPELPRCKIQIGDYLVPILICKSPVILGAFPEFLEIKNFNQIADWVSAHEDTLLRHWRKEITDSTALIALTDRRKTLAVNDNCVLLQMGLHWELQ